MTLIRAIVSGWSGTANGNRVMITFSSASPRTSTPIQNVSSPNSAYGCVAPRNFRSIAFRGSPSPCTSRRIPAAASASRVAAAVFRIVSALVNSTNARPLDSFTQRSTPAAKNFPYASPSFGSGPAAAVYTRICRSYGNGDPTHSSPHASPPNRPFAYSSPPSTASVALVRITDRCFPNSSSRKISATSTGAECNTVARFRPSRSSQYTCPSRLCARNASSSARNPSPVVRNPRTSVRVSSSTSFRRSICRPSRSPIRSSKSGTSVSMSSGSRSVLGLAFSPKSAAVSMRRNIVGTSVHSRSATCAAGPSRNSASNPFPDDGTYSRRSQCSNACGDSRIPKCSLAVPSTVCASSSTTAAT